LPTGGGSLAIGFSAERFADTEVGDVWEGIDASFLASRREAELAALVVGNLPDEASTTPLLDVVEIREPILAEYAVFADGKLLQHGTLGSERSSEEGSASETIDSSYLATLEGLALRYIDSKCPGSQDTVCVEPFVSPDLVEWRIRVSRSEQSIGQIELLHERSFSGLGATYNIVFSLK
jgi:hypothetical protein